MNNTFSSQQISQTGGLDSNLILQQYKVDLMARFMEMKFLNPRLRQDQVAKDLCCPSGTLQRHSQDISMLPPYRNPPNSNKRKQKISNCKHDLKIPQMTSNDLKRRQLTSKKSSSNFEMVKHKTSKKKKLKRGGNNETKDNYLDEVLQNNNP